MKNYIPPSSENGCKPEINYPCSWQYKVIGEDREAVIKAITACVQEKAHLLTDSHKSSGGRYVSMSLELVVSSEEERLEIYHKLLGDPAVKIVL